MTLAFDKSPLSLASLRLHWPKDAAFLAFGGASGRHVIVATAFTEIPYQSIRTLSLTASRPSASAHAGDEPPFSTGVMGVLDYDHLADPSGSSSKARCFRVDRALVLDRHTGRLQMTGGDGGRDAPGRLGISPAQVEQVLAAVSAGAVDGPSEGPLSLAPLTSDAAYRELVVRALEDIRDGRFYQINLLRYFRLESPPSTRQLAERFAVMSGPYGAWVEVPGLSLVSFSPEAFVQIEPRAEGTRIETRPVKGTLARGDARADDEARAKALLASPKDRAELAMIVDLMRNDLSRVALPGSVRVEEPLRLLSVPTVHHLEARIAAWLAPGTTLGALLDALCPAGSITGAPKREVMRAIREYEGRERGYFMGHAFYLDDHGRFDSSVMIRTLCRRGEATAGNPYEFAAGSGIVVRSDPEAERLETLAKARILTAPATAGGVSC